MATYSGNGWQSTNLSFTGRHSGNNPYKPGEFKVQFPIRPADRATDAFDGRPESTSTQIYVKIKNGKTVDLKNDGKDYQGDEWKAFTITQPNEYNGYGLNQFAKDRNFEWKEKYLNEARGFGDRIKNERNDNITANEAARTKNEENRILNEQDQAYNETVPGLRQAEADKFNTEGDRQVTKANSINDWSDAAVRWAKASPTGNYVGNRSQINSNASGGQGEFLTSLVNDGYLTNDEKDTFLGTLTTSYKTYYANTRVTPWDYEAQGINPPVGGFDSKYYLTENQGGQNLQGTWNNAVLNDDLDITVRYGNQGTFAWNSYSTTGKAAGYRGNAAVATAESDAYREDFQKNFTDAERQLIRDNQLGLTGERISNGEPIRTVNWEDNVGGDLETIIGGSIAQKELTEQDKFKGLGLDMQTAAVNELKKAQQRERELDIYKGLPGFSEIFNMNATLSNAILGDSGVGGILGTMGVNTSSLSENFEDQIGQYTGVNFNSSEYNWQKWFNDTLIKDIENKGEVLGFGVDYDQDTGEVTIGDERTTVYQLEEDFKKNFIDNYVTPRFDLSKSMDEFISYVDTIDKETDQNIFQTQTAVNALRDIAALRAENFYSSLETQVGGAYEKSFDPDFYFNPGDSAKYGTVNDDKKLAYKAQKDTVAADWQKAKDNPNAVAISLTAKEAEEFGLSGGRTNVTWADLSYLYGLDLQDKASFARLHYDQVGRGENFDPARDVVTDSDVKDFINNNVLSAVDDARNEFGDSPFLEFVTPEEFANEILEGIDPLENKEEWKELLELYGLDESATLNEVKEYILESVRTGAAKDIREGIKYLNQKSKKPTQKELGVTYIERDEDAQPEEDPDADALYKTFKNAGFGGSQEEFYETFMPDMDRTDIDMITQGLEGLQFKGADMSDPFTALGSVQGFLGDESTDLFGTSSDNEDREKDNEPGYFDLFADEKDDDDYASDTGRDLITDFTSFFK